MKITAASGFGISALLVLSLIVTLLKLKFEK